MQLLWRRLALVAWCLGWLTIAVWTAWFTWQAADNPRKEDLRTWCAARMRYVHQEFVSSLNQIEILAGLVKAFNGVSNAPNTPAHWGLKGYITNATWIAFSEQWIQRIQPWSLTTWAVCITHEERPVFEQILNCTVKTLLGSMAPAAPFYAVTIFRFPIYEFPPCTNVYTVYPPVVDHFLRTGERAAMPPVLFPTQHIGLVYGIPIVRSPFTTHVTMEQGRAKMAGFIAGAIDTETLISHALMDVLNQSESGVDLTQEIDDCFLTQELSNYIAGAGAIDTKTLIFYALMDVLNQSEFSRSRVKSDMTAERGEGVDHSSREWKGDILANLIRKGSGILSAFLDPATIPPGDKEVQPFPEPFCSRTFEVHCRFLDSGSAWRLVWAPVLVAVLVALVALLLTLIVVFLARKQAAISCAVREVELCTAVLERAQRSKSHTVANLSHELRTPIVGMLGMMEALLESEMQGPQQLSNSVLCLPLPCPTPNQPHLTHDGGATGERPAGGATALNFLICLPLHCPNHPHLTSSSPQGMMEALLESELQGGQHRDLAVAKECAAAIVGQLNSVLDLAKLHAGRLSLETLPLSLHHCVDMVARDLLPEACKRGVHMVCQVDCSVPEVLLGDPLRLAQVVRELISHAIRTTISGHVAFRVLCIPMPSPSTLGCSPLTPPLTTPAPADAMTPSQAAADPSNAAAAPLNSAAASHAAAPLNSAAASHAAAAAAAAAASGSAGGEGGVQCKAWLASWLDEACRQCSGGSDSSGGSGGSGTILSAKAAAATAAAAGEGSSDGEGGGAGVDYSEPGGEEGREEAEREVGQMRALLRELEGCVSRFSDGSVVCAAVDTAADAADDVEEGCRNERHGGAEQKERKTKPAVPSAWWGWRQSVFWREVHQGEARGEEGDSKEGAGGGEGGAGRGGLLVVMVCEDTGGGISPEELQWVLDPEGRAAVQGRGDSLLQRGVSNKGRMVRAATHAMPCHAMPHDSFQSLPPNHCLPITAFLTCFEASQSRSICAFFLSPLTSLQNEAPLVSPMSALHRSVDFWPGSAAPPSQPSSAPAWEPYPVRFLLSTGLVKLMRGTMGIATQHHVGTTILISLPMAACHLSETGAVAADAGGSGGCGGGMAGRGASAEVQEWVDHRKAICSLVAGKTALLLDAMPLRAQATEACLHYLGMEVTLAASPAQAMRLMRHPPTTTTTGGGSGGGGGGGSGSGGGGDAGGGGWDVVLVDVDVAGPRTGLHVGEKILRHAADAAAASAAASDAATSSQGRQGGVEAGREAGRAVVVLTGARADSVESEQAERMGFAAVLLHPWLVTHTTHCLQHRFNLPFLPLLHLSHAALLSHCRAAAIQSARQHPKCHSNHTHHLCLAGASHPPPPSRSLGPPLPNDTALLSPSASNPPPAAVLSPLAVRHVAPEEELRALVGQQAVVVVDDNAVNRAVARRTLLALGALVHLAAGGAQALDWLRQHMAAATRGGQEGLGQQQQQQWQAEGPEAERAVPLVLLDLQMPDMDGYETVRRIRAMEVEAAASDTPAGEAHAGGSRGWRRRWCVVALTADVDGDVRRVCAQAGMDGVVAKPIVPRDLLPALKSAGYRS
ncbi:unnamed protein product [Closterium sp. Naga37s-1]|nr:unnamed protein product [Closterium sp. Naga37s-1]